MHNKGEISPYQIVMFGKFSMRSGEHVVSDDIGRTHKLWNLLEYLIQNRNNTITTEGLCEAIWDGEDSDNPNGALKNLVYRLRNVLTANGFDSDCIVFKGGVYSWNEKIPCIIDTQQFEDAWAQAQHTSSTERQIACYETMAALYTGTYLPKSSYRKWVMPISRYYHTLYMDCILRLCDLYICNAEYEKAIRICEQAISIDGLYEAVYTKLIDALIRMGRHQDALKIYNTASELFFQEFGASLSQQTRALYKEIVKSIHDEEMDLKSIQKDLHEVEEVRGAFVCEYEIFKNVYRIFSRLTERSDQNVYILLFTITTTGNKIPQANEAVDAMGALQEVLVRCLRKGDIVSRFSRTQYVAMLCSMTASNCQKVSERLTASFYDRQKEKSIWLNCKFSKVTT